MTTRDAVADLARKMTDQLGLSQDDATRAAALAVAVLGEPKPDFDNAVKPVPADDPMPVFVIKAKDQLAIRAVSAYRRLCEERNLHDQAEQVRLAAAEMSAWRERNPGAVKLPDHPHVPTR